MNEYQETVLHYVALGDSLAAGVTPFGEIGRGYPDFLAVKLEKMGIPVHFQNFGVHGFTTEKLKHQMESQINARKVIKKANMITLNIGANDFFQTLVQDPKNVSFTLKTFSENLTYILAELKKLNQQADVYVIGYYNPFLKHPEKRHRKLTRMLNYVNKLIEEKTKEYHYIFISTERAISERYNECIVNPEDYHLSLIGYEIISELTFQAIKMKEQKPLKI